MYVLYIGYIRTYIHTVHQEFFVLEVAHNSCAEISEGDFVSTLLHLLCFQLPRGLDPMC